MSLPVPLLSAFFLRSPAWLCRDGAPERSAPAVRCNLHSLQRLLQGSCCRASPKGLLCCVRDARGMIVIVRGTRRGPRAATTTTVHFYMTLAGSNG